MSNNETADENGRGTHHAVKDIQTAHRTAENVESRVVGTQLAAVVNNPERAIVELAVNAICPGGVSGDE